jgi:anthranilate synthase component 2
VEEEVILLIDNYDSFTYNLYHYLGELGTTVEVFATKDQS